MNKKSQRFCSNSCEHRPYLILFQMSNKKKDETNTSGPNDKAEQDDEIDRLARQMLLDEAKRNKIRAETQGALGWQRPTMVTNRKFLRNTLISNAVHNIHRNEQSQQHKRRRSASPTSTRKSSRDERKK
jgi:hypothetical protein